MILFGAALTTVSNQGDVHASGSVLAPVAPSATVDDDPLVGRWLEDPSEADPSGRDFLTLRADGTFSVFIAQVDARHSRPTEKIAGSGRYSAATGHDIVLRFDSKPETASLVYVLNGDTMWTRTARGFKDTFVRQR